MLPAWQSRLEQVQSYERVPVPWCIRASRHKLQGPIYGRNHAALPASS